MKYAGAVSELVAACIQGLLTEEELESAISNIEFDSGLICCTPPRRVGPKPNRLFKSVNAYITDLVSERGSVTAQN
jgi:hypothetical protein